MIVAACVVLVVALAHAVVGAGRQVSSARVRGRTTGRLAAPRAGALPGSGQVARAVGPLTRARDARRYEGALPDVLDHLAAGIRAGASVPQALTAAAGTAGASVGADLSTLVRELEQGASLDAALAAWHRRRPLRGVELTAAALDLGSRYGGRQATAVDEVAEAVRARLGLRREVRALSAQARASAWVMAATPVVFAAMSAALDPRVAGMLLGSVLGWACLLGGTALDVAAAAWMHHITDTALGPAA